MGRTTLHDPVQARPTQVTLEQAAGNVDRMIRKFTRLVRAEGIIRDFKVRSRFTKPSAARRTKRARTHRDVK